MGNLAAILSDLLPRIVCPKCKAALIAAPDADAPVSIRCTGCGNQYPIVEGIPVLLIERAANPTRLAE